MGSFLNVIIWRLPREEKITGRSACPHCGHSLGVFDLFPIFSFIFLGAKCRYCKGKISVRYPIIEILMGVLFAVTYIFFSPIILVEWILFLKALIFIFLLTAIFVIDLEHFLILDNIILFGCVILTIINILLDFYAPYGFFGLRTHAVGGLLAGCLAAIPFFAIWFFSKGLWMGFGDVKLALFLGVALGWPLIWAGLFIGVILGGITSIFLLAFANKGLKTKLPFGTFLSVGAFLALFFGTPLLKWYLALLGF